MAADPVPDPNDPDFLDWLADRLVYVYGESPNVDFVLALRRKAMRDRSAIDRDFRVHRRAIADGR